MNEFLTKEAVAMSENDKPEKPFRAFSVFIFTE